jgi:hypothetical protein
MSRPAAATRSRAKATLTWLSWAATATTLYRGVRGTAHVAASRAWLAYSQPEPTPSPPARPALRFALLLPALREQRLLPGTTAHLLQLARATPLGRRWRW